MTNKLNNVSASEAIERLKQGNKRFVAGAAPAIVANEHPNFGALHATQAPFVIVLGCSDSRVPVEFVFDQTFGDMFVIRIAGNVVAPSQIASIEFAATQFDTHLVVVLGHTQCGAVGATIDCLQSSSTDESSRPIGHLDSIVKRIQPAVEPLLDQAAQLSAESFYELAVRSNIAASVEQLKSGSPILQNLIESDNLKIIGAEYSLDDGAVTFFE